jgi:hypothetical protein
MENSAVKTAEDNSLEVSHGNAENTEELVTSSESDTFASKLKEMESNPLFLPNREGILHMRQHGKAPKRVASLGIL